MSVLLSVSIYVCLYFRFRGNVNFSASNWDISPIFLWAHSSFLSDILIVGLSVRLQKAKELRYLWKSSSLFYLYIPLTTSTSPWCSVFSSSSENPFSSFIFSNNFKYFISSKIQLLLFSVHMYHYCYKDR